MPNLIKDRSILSLMLVTLAFTVRFFNQKLRYYFDCVVCRFSRGTWYGTKPFKRLVPCDLCIMELTLKGVLYTRLARKGFLMSGSAPPPPPPPLIDPTTMPYWWAPIRAKQLSIAVTGGVIWLCAGVRYWPYAELVHVLQCIIWLALDGLQWKMIFLKQIKYF